MLGLGSNISKAPSSGATIVTDNLVLRHGYALNPVQPLSDGAASFNGTSDFIQLTNAISNNVFSISAWVNVTEDATAKTILDARDGDNDGIAFRVDVNEKLLMQINNSDSAKSSAAQLTVGTWQHVVGTYDGTNIKLYIDGILVETTADAGSSETVSTTTAARIGEFAFGDGYFKGYICNVGVWEAALDQDEVKSIMNKNYADLTSSEKTDLVSWWNLDSTISEDYASTIETDTEPSTITGLTLDNHDTTFTETSITNSDFTSGSGTTITGWTNDGNQWTRVDDTVVSGTSAQLLRMPSALENNTAHKIIIRAKRTTLDSAATLSVYIGGNNYATHSLTNDFVEYITHGLQANDTTLFLYNHSSTNVTIDWVKVYKYDGNVGNLL